MSRSLKVITGPMFAGKTNCLVNKASRMKVSGYFVLPILPKIQGVQEKSRLGTKFSNIMKLPLNYSVEDYCKFFENFVNKTCFAIDEFHLFKTNMAIAIRKVLLRNGKDVTFIVSGLTKDYAGRPFNTMKEIVCYADNIICLKAVCSVCKNDACRTKRLSGDTSKILIDPSAYTAVCEKCYYE